MIVLIDSNVVLDVVLKNAVLVTTSRVVLDSAEKKHFTGYISSSAITDIYLDYIVTRNTKDFTFGSIPIVTPEQFMQIVIDISNKTVENNNTAI